jgi:O-methyltransferase
MRKIIKKFINSILKRKGVIIARIHEIDFVNQKYLNLISETEELFRELIFDTFPKNPKRLKLLAQLNGTQISEAFYILNYLHESLRKNGDICEFGIANGTTSSLIANEIRNTDKALWLFDSFQGLSKPTKKDRLIKDIFNLGSMDKYEGTMSYKQEEVLSRLAAISFPRKRTKIIPGFIEDTIKQSVLPKKVAFAYVDFDLYEPILVALQYLDTTMVKGGYIVVDDYGTFSEVAKISVDEFVELNKKKYKLILTHKFAGHFCVLNKLN